MISLSPDKIDKWLELIRISDNELSRLNNISEKEFIKIGGDFQNFFYRSKEITKLSASISEILSGNDISGTIEKLQNFLKELNHYAKDSETLSDKANDTLRQIRTSINEIYSPLDGFKKSVKLLNILGISIRIEDANLNSERKEFQILAEEVTKLAEVIRNKLDTTKKQTDNLDKMIIGTLDNVSNLKKNQHNTNDLIISRIDQSLNELLEKRSGSEEVLNVISASSKDISRKTGDIVAAIQFHDITRQQIEHVQQALRKIENYRNDETEITGDNCEMIVFTKEVCTLQTTQLKQAVNNIYDASGHIREGLMSLDNLISQFISQTEVLTGFSDDNHNSVLNEIQHEIESVSVSLKENADSNRELVNTVSSSVETIEKISSLLNDIKNAGMDIEMISLNAIIKTAKLGTQGAALSVLASSIRGLSIDTADQIKNIDETIKGITGISQELRRGITEKTNENVEEIETMTGKLNELIRIAGAADLSLMKILGEMINEGNRLRNEIKAVLENLKIEEVFSYSFDIVLKNLQEIINDIPHGSIDEKCGGNTKGLRILENNYTMQTEREIHKSVISKNLQNNLQNSNESIFDNNNDNIELF